MHANEIRQENISLLIPQQYPECVFIKPSIQSSNYIFFKVGNSECAFKRNLLVDNAWNKVS